MSFDPTQAAGLHLPRRRPLPSIDRLGGVVRELARRDTALTVFGLTLLASMIPPLLAMGFDDRLLRGVNIWVKPLKFMASVGLYALTLAWFVGHVDAAWRRARPVRVVVWTTIVAGGFEVGYVTLMAGLGSASHFNTGTPLTVTMYALMGAGALALTATSPLLAWQIVRHGDPALDPAYRASVVLGLALTFVLGAGVGSVLAQLQPPTGPALPVLGWSTVAGDLRPAHFFGIHAQQLLPLAGAAVAAMLPRRGLGWVSALAAGYAAFTLAVFAQAMAGRPFIG